MEKERERNTCKKVVTYFTCLEDENANNVITYKKGGGREMEVVGTGKVECEICRVTYEKGNQMSRRNQERVRSEERRVVLERRPDSASRHKNKRHARARVHVSGRATGVETMRRPLMVCGQTAG